MEEVGVRLRAVIVLVYVMLGVFHRRKNITIQHDSETHETYPCEKVGFADEILRKPRKNCYLTYGWIAK